MGVTVKPTITIDGEPLACSAEALDLEPVAIKGFSITWGRDDYQSSSVSPASAEISIIDTTEEWAGRIRTRNALGLKVEISWIGYSVPADTPDAEPTLIGPIIMFRGRITSAEARPRRISASNGRRAWEISLTLADRTADYGNALAPPVEWPRQTMLNRAIAIRDLGLEAGSEIEQVYFWPGYTAVITAPLDVKNASALDLMGEFYASMGNDTYSYDPHENVIRQFIRLSQPMTTYLATFDSSQGAVMPVPNDIEVDEKIYPGVALGGCELLGEPAVIVEPEQDINRLECSWKDHSTGHNDWTTVKEDVKAGDARRVMSWSSWIDGGITIDATLENVWDRARQEGARPRHPAISMPTTHEFVSERLARWLLSTWANTRPAYIAGSMPYLWLMADMPDYSPIVAPIGGETRYNAIEGFSATLNVHWIHNNGTPITPARWASLQQVRTSYDEPSVPWWWSLLGLPIPAPVPVGEPTPERDLKWGHPDRLEGYGWAPSVTWADARHIEDANTQIKDVLT